MVARISTYTGSSERLDDLTRGFDQSADAVRELDGFEGAYLLVQPGSGEAMTVALWSSPESAEASDQRVSQIRTEAAQLADHSVASVAVYEVASEIRA
jgi:heme-degrading monooxygenase HmoA